MIQGRDGRNLQQAKLINVPLDDDADLMRATAATCRSALELASNARPDPDERSTHSSLNCLANTNSSRYEVLSKHLSHEYQALRSLATMPFNDYMPMLTTSTTVDRIHPSA